MEEKDKIIVDIDSILDKVDEKVEKIENPKEPEEECLPCKYNVGIGMSLSICEEAEIEGVDCEDLKNKYKNEELSPLQVMDTLIDKIGLQNTNENKFDRQIDELKELKGLMGLDAKPEPEPEPAIESE